MRGSVTALCTYRVVVIFVPIAEKPTTSPSADPTSKTCSAAYNGFQP